MWLSGTNKGACLVFWNTTIKNIQHRTPQKKILCIIFLSFKKIVHCGTESIKSWCCMGKVSRCLFVRCWGLSLRENEAICPHHNSSCLASSLSLSSSTFSLSSSAVIAPSLFRSWLLNMSTTTCSMVSPGFIRPLPSVTCSWMNSPN